MTGYPRNRYTIGAHFHGTNGTIQAGSQANLLITEDFLIEGWYMLADQSGSAVVDVWSDTFDNYPATNADTITGGAEPALSGAIKSQGSGLSAWTRRLEAFSVLVFNVDSAAVVQALDIYLWGSRR